jgi:hypothetical protein
MKVPPFPLPPIDTEPGNLEYNKAIKQLARLEGKFSRIVPRGKQVPYWRGQVGAIDGVIFRTFAPTKAVSDPKRYKVVRKGCFGVLVMAIADADRRILWWSIETAATSHDSLAWRMTELGQRISAGGLPFPYFLSGDNAFKPGGNSMAVPGKDDLYNYIQSSGRMPVECSFGMVVRSYGILWRPLQVRFKRRAPLLSALFSLYNRRIESRVPFLVDYPIKKRRVVVNGSVVLREMWEVLPGQWEFPPHLDNDGNPVRLLSRRKTTYVDATNGPDMPDPRQSTYERLVQAAQNSGVTRPDRTRESDHEGWQSEDMYM